MAEATSSSPSTCNIKNIPKSLVYEDKNTLTRNASFSSYLNKETFILNVFKSNTNSSPLVTSPKNQLNKMREKINEGTQTGIFNDNGKKEQEKKDEKKVKPMTITKTKIMPRNSSVSSKRSSNSQSSLLPITSNQKSQSSSKQKIKFNGRKCLNRFSFKCSCSDGKSVDIEENVVNRDIANTPKELTKTANKIDEVQANVVQKKQTQSPSLSKAEISYQKCDNLDVDLADLNVDAGNSTVEKQLEEKEGKTSKVIESSVCLDKNVSQIIMDIPTSTDINGSFYDMESDSSSDLFEIKNFSEKLATPCDQSEPKIEVMVKNPKEITSSVTTSSKNKLTIAKISITKKNKPKIAKVSMAKKIQRSRNSILQSCKNHKAVKVVGSNTYMISKNKEKSDPQRRLRSNSIEPISEFRTTSRAKRTSETMRPYTRKSFS